MYTYSIQLLEILSFFLYTYYQIGVKEDGVTQTLLVPEISCENSGEYKIHIKNDGGVAESSLKLDVSSFTKIDWVVGQKEKFQYWYESIYSALMVLSVKFNSIPKNTYGIINIRRLCFASYLDLRVLKL